MILTMENSKTLWKYRLMKKLKKMTNRHQRLVSLGMIKEQATLSLEMQMWTWMKLILMKRDNFPRRRKRHIGVRSIIEHFDKMIEDANQMNFCFQCGGEHALEVCPEMNDNMMANALNRMRTVMEEQSKSPSSDRSRTAKITRGPNDKLPKKSVMPQGKRWSRTRFTEKEEVSKSFYNQPANMCEIGGREEGGALLVNGIEVNKKGQGVKVCRIKISLIC